MIGARMMMGAAGRLRASADIGGAISFPGTADDYLATSAPTFAVSDTDTRTIGAWIRMIPGGGEYPKIIGTGGDQDYSFGRWAWQHMSANREGGRWIMRATDGDTASQADVAATNAGHDDTWRLVIYRFNAGTWDAATATVGATAVAGGPAPYTGNLLHDYIFRIGNVEGARSFEIAPFAAKDVFIAPSVLALDDITSIAAGEPIDNVCDPINWWPLGGADDLVDYGSQGNNLIKHGELESVLGPFDAA